MATPCTNPTLTPNFKGILFSRTRFITWLFLPTSTLCLATTAMAALTRVTGASYHERTSWGGLHWSTGRWAKTIMASSPMCPRSLPMCINRETHPLRSIMSLPSTPMACSWSQPLACSSCSHGDGNSGHPGLNNRWTHLQINLMVFEREIYNTMPEACLPGSQMHINHVRQFLRRYHQSHNTLDGRIGHTSWPLTSFGTPVTA